MQRLAGGPPALNQAQTEQVLRCADPSIENAEGIGTDRSAAKAAFNVSVRGARTIGGELGFAAEGPASATPAPNTPAANRQSPGGANELAIRLPLL
ncbi:MAG: hypothetical protein A4E19_12305 [Nitrospira sp. SG-bin1]|nr:MAG: hypothetical protein A4E19_12305 [Nitrospira sp. SG-bin1]